MAIRTYVLAALALGMISTFGSETLFWSAPRPDTSLAELVLIILPYSLVSAAVLSVVALTRCGGLRGAFLGGAILGYLIEGVVVGTMYDAFPLQLVWTPLAWHALITGVLVFGFARTSARLSVSRQVTYLALLGLAGGVWAGYWPLERAEMPSAWVAFAYLGAGGVSVALANMILDRVGLVPRPPTKVLLIAPALLLCLWIAQSLADPRPQRLALPLLLWLIYWTMTRLGAGQAAPDFGSPPQSAGRHWLFMIVPSVAAAVAGVLWRETGGIESNYVVAITGGLVALVWLGRLVWLAYKAPSASARSRAPS